MRTCNRSLHSCLGFVIAAVLLTPVVRVGAREYRMPDEPRYVPVEYPDDVLQRRAGFILDFRPDSWKALDLSGVWKIKRFPAGKGEPTDFEDPGLKAGFQNPASKPDGWDEIDVPHSLQSGWRKQGADGFFRGVAWYRTAFTLPEDWLPALDGGWRVLLRFEGVRSTANAWLNGRMTGLRMSGYHAFEHDLTHSVERSAPNVLTVRVAGGASHYRQRNRDGLWQPVRLFCVPPTYAAAMLVAPRIEPPGVTLELRLVNHGQALSMELEAVLAPYGNAAAKPRAYALGARPIKRGMSTERFELATPDVRVWWPDTPHLYLLSVRSGETELGRVRFGFRTFEATDGRFLLNGKRAKLMGSALSGDGIIRARDKWGCNHYNEARKLIHALRQANIDFVRPHGGAFGRPLKTLLNVCDEEGMLLYDEYDYLGSRHYADDAFRSRETEYTEWVRYVHNHPSLIMWDYGGNEIYTADLEIIPLFNKLHDLLGEIDLQRRPRTSSSGRLTTMRLEKWPVLEKADFADSHCYPGYSFGSYQEFIDLFERFDRAARTRYGAIPKINCEWGYPGDVVRYRAVTKKIQDLYNGVPWDKDEKRRYIEFIRSDTPEIGGYLRGKGNWVSAKTYVTDPAGVYEQAAVFMKRFLEVFRRSGALIDGGHMNCQWYDLLKASGLGAAARYLGTPNPTAGVKGFLKSPCFYAFRRAYSDLFICLDEHPRHVFAGGAWRATAHVMNDSLSASVDGRAILQLRGPDGTLIEQREIWAGPLAPGTHERVPVQLQLPAAGGSTPYTVELFLLDSGGRQLCDNAYPLELTAAADLSSKIEPAGKVALYEVQPEQAGEGASAANTAAVLGALQVPHARVKDFSGLDEYPFLVIGRNSFDKTLIEGGAQISRWVHKGGRLLCFEQEKAIALPFLPEVSVSPGKNATFTDVLAWEHPVFAGLAQRHFDVWDGELGCLFRNALSPLNEGLLAVGPTIGAKDDSFMMIAAAYGVGEGEVVLSQYELTQRYGHDSVATKFAQNLLAYLLTQPRSPYSLPFASTVTEKDTAYIGEEEVFFVDLSRAVNRGLEGGPDSWAGFFGGGFAEIPLGVTRLSGRVPFRVIDPRKNDGRACLVLAGEKKPDFPERAGPIPVGKKASVLYILHTAMYAAYPEGETLYGVYLTLGDGTRRHIPIRNKKEIGDWWKASDLPGAKVAFTVGNKNLYVTELVLGDEPEMIESIEFESTEKAIPIIVAVTVR